jgi:hypothetical protein
MAFDSATNRTAWNPIEFYLPFFLLWRPQGDVGRHSENDEIGPRTIIGERVKTAGKSGKPIERRLISTSVRLVWWSEHTAQSAAPESTTR